MLTLVIRRQKLFLDQDLVVYGVEQCEYCCYIVESNCKLPQVASVVF